MTNSINNVMGEVYLSERLWGKLLKIQNYPLIVVEAPMGYGKTTGIKEFLKLNGFSFFWIPILDSSVPYFWTQFSEAISSINHEAGYSLLKCDPPKTRDEACALTRIFNSEKLESHFFIVIDDYQMVKTHELDIFFETLARENISTLHVILIGRQPFELNREELELKSLLYPITQKNLRFSLDECSKYFEASGIKLSNGKADEIYRLTDGWISGLVLIKQNYLETKALSVPSAVYKLLAKSIFDPLDNTIKNFLLRMCIFDSFSLFQAEKVCDEINVNEVIGRIISLNIFVEYNEQSELFLIHPLFCKYLKKTLRSYDESFKKEVYRKGADWYYSVGEFFKSTVYYYDSGEYELMLQAFELDKGNSLTAKTSNVMIEAFANCPEDIKIKYPMAHLIFVKQLSMMDQKDLLQAEIHELRNNFDNDRIEYENKDALLGEFQMLLSFLSYNDVNKMARYHQKAAKYLKQPSSIEGSKGCWTYGAPSVLYMFYREPGSLDKLIEDLKQSRPLYYSLTDGNGKGGEYVLEAEAFYYRGDFDQAEILSYKALDAAMTHNQIGVIACALFLQARTSMMRGETDKGIGALRQMKKMILDSKEYLFMYTANMCKAFCYTCLGQTKLISKWLLNGEFEDTAIYYPAMNFVYIVYGRVLLELDKYSKLLGLADAFHESADKFPNLLTKIYLYIYQAIAYRRLRNFAGATFHIHKALDLAYEDEIILPFVENGKEIVDFIDDMLTVAEQENFVKKIKSTYAVCEKNLEIIVSESSKDPFFLMTQREKQIATLVGEGKTNLDIAKALNIAEITVKKCLSNIYSRLSIANRAELAKIITKK